MKKQLLILGIFVAVVIGFLFVTTRPNSSTTTWVSTGAQNLATDDIVDQYLFDYDTDHDETVAPNLEGKVFVDVQGEVVNPGLFEVDSGVRVGYLIERAGGLTADANVRGLNQAARIYDEMVIFVPHVDDLFMVVNGETTVDEALVYANDSSLISLSTATAIELQTLPGIGPTLSANIITHREVNGAFSSVDALVDVPGIGNQTVDNIREFVQP